MKKVITILSILFIINCSIGNNDKSGDNIIITKTSPSRKGCSEYKKSDDWFDCMSIMIRDYQNIQNSSGNITLIKSKRIDSYTVNRIYRICFTQKLCRDFNQTYPDPSLWGKIKESSPLVIGGIIIGYLLAL